MDVLCELYPVEMTAIFASKRIFAAAATGGARTAELPTIGELSSKFDVFLAGRSQFDSDYCVDFYATTCCQSATFVRRLFAFYCPLFLTKKKKKSGILPPTPCLRCVTDGFA